MELKKRFNNLGMEIPRIHLPKKDLDYNKWAVIACDQYTSDFEYWQDISGYIGKQPSTLNLIYPECYLEEENPEIRISSINSTMDEYLKTGVLEEQKPALYLIRRETPFSPARHGLLLALDLDRYNFEKGSTSLIRATEGTILDRIPPRKRIRGNAALELPHIMVLIDDPDHTVIEPLTVQTPDLEKMYQFSLMKNGGKITSFRIDQNKILDQIISAFEILASSERQKKMYGSEKPFLFAMGDGNHSLATAKSVWEDLKKDPKTDRETHPARYALVEICNIHDPGILFEPIHRILFNTSSDDLMDIISDSSNIEFIKAENINQLVNDVKSSEEHLCGIISGQFKGTVLFKNPDYSAVTGSVDTVISKLMNKSEKIRIDYIHGDSAICKLGSEPGNIGFILPSIRKDSFFSTIVNDGVFPRKTFSMGESDEKRFYIEARKIKF